MIAQSPRRAEPADANGAMGAGVPRPVDNGYHFGNGYAVAHPQAYYPSGSAYRTPTKTPPAAVPPPPQPVYPAGAMVPFAGYVHPHMPVRLGGGAAGLRRSVPLTPCGGAV